MTTLANGHEILESPHLTTVCKRADCGCACCGGYEPHCADLPSVVQEQAMLADTRAAWAADQRTSTERCAECMSRLRVAFDLIQGWTTRCMEDVNHEGTRRSRGRKKAA